MTKNDEKWQEWWQNGRKAARNWAKETNFDPLLVIIKVGMGVAFLSIATGALLLLSKLPILFFFVLFFGFVAFLVGSLIYDILQDLVPF